jgi:hypothetical protein
MPVLKRRRSRRRAIGPLVAVGIIGALLLFLLIGGIAHISSSSGPFHVSVNRSFGAQATVITEQSNVTGAALNSLLGDMSGLARPELQSQMDQLADASERTADQADGLTPPAPSPDVGSGFAAVFDQRAQAVATLRHSIDGLLQMAPLPVAGAATTTSAAAPSAPLSAAAATAGLSAASGLATRSDAGYAGVRSAFAAGAGHVLLPRSVWVDPPAQWASGALATVVDEVSTSPSLAIDHQLALTAVRLDPAVVPSPPGSTPGTAVLPPTQQLVVTVVLTNQGNVNERPTTSLTLQSTKGGAPVVRTQIAVVVAGGARALVFSALPVAYAQTYTLSVVVTPPPGQVAGALLNEALTVYVSPGTPQGVPAG